MTINAKVVRLIERRRREQNPEFKDKYRTRSGLEATNRILKRVTGLDRLRVRGRPAVFSSILLKVAGWNLLRAASLRSLITKLTKTGQAGSSVMPYAVIWTPLQRVRPLPDRFLTRIAA